MCAKYDVNSSLAMLACLVSVGVNVFDVTLLDIEGRKRGIFGELPGYEGNCTAKELEDSMDWRLERTDAEQRSLIVRPRVTATLLVQCDDLSPEQVERLAPFSFLALETSPGNFQVWMAVLDGPRQSAAQAARDFQARVRRGVGADPSATGTTQIAGSRNFKKRYAPDFPLIKIAQRDDGQVTLMAALDRAGFIATDVPDAAQSKAAVNGGLQPAAPRGWPDYQLVFARGAVETRW